MAAKTSTMKRARKDSGALPLPLVRELYGREAVRAWIRATLRSIGEHARKTVG